MMRVDRHPPRRAALPSAPPSPRTPPDPPRTQPPRTRAPIAARGERPYRDDPDAGLRRRVIARMTRGGPAGGAAAGAAALELDGTTYHVVRRSLERHPAAPLTLRPGDPSLGALTHDRAVIAADDPGGPDMMRVNRHPPRRAALPSAPPPPRTPPGVPRTRVPRARAPIATRGERPDRGDPGAGRRRRVIARMTRGDPAVVDAAGAAALEVGALTARVAGRERHRGAPVTLRAVDPGMRPGTPTRAVIAPNTQEVPT